MVHFHSLSNEHTVIGTGRFLVGGAKICGKQDSEIQNITWCNMYIYWKRYIWCTMGSSRPKNFQKKYTSIWCHHFTILVNSQFHYAFNTIVSPVTVIIS